ncbi:hypothetical protein [Anaerophilus nitritogenes]|nr:hypothetical protein [Anaerophilus nitritogenes]
MKLVSAVLLVLSTMALLKDVIKDELKASTILNATIMILNGILLKM